MTINMLLFTTSALVMFAAWLADSVVFAFAALPTAIFWCKLLDEVIALYDRS